MTMRHLIKNIGTIAGILEDGSLRKEGSAMDTVGTLENAYLVIEDGKIAGYGPSALMPDENGFDTMTDAHGGFVLPSFCDSHSHVVYAGSRDGEFLDKINGLSYEEIARRGGGILNSADLLHETSEDELYRQSLERVREVMHMGTGALEIKSGYGLTTEDELKMLRVIRDSSYHHKGNIPRSPRCGTGLQGETGRIRQTRMH